jgi:Protein of unknown function (DUF3892)
MELQIVCINKPYGHNNAHEAVTNYGYRDPLSGQTMIATRQNMVDWAKTPGNQAYVVDRYGNRANCYVNHNGTTEFLQTKRDFQWTDNLLALTECPLPAR